MGQTTRGIYPQENGLWQVDKWWKGERFRQRSFATQSEAEGSIKVVADAKTNRLLGMHAISAGAGDIVHQGMIAMEFVSSIEDLQLMTFAHPTISEAVHEAALSADGRAIHAIQRKKRKK